MLFSWHILIYVFLITNHYYNALFHLVLALIEETCLESTVLGHLAFYWARHSFWRRLIENFYVSIFSQIYEETFASVILGLIDWIFYKTVIFCCHANQMHSKSFSQSVDALSCYLLSKRLTLSFILGGFCRGLCQCWCTMVISDSALKLKKSGHAY